MKRAPALLMLAAPAAAEVSERPDSVRVTVYHAGGESDPQDFRDPDPKEGLAFITETRTIDVPAGPATIEFRGVASTIIPQTAAVEGLPVPLLERNFDYDLLSPGSLLKKSIGETVTLVRTDKKTGKMTERRAVLRTGPDGAVLDFGGSFEALHCSALPERLVFAKVPEGLRDTPTLSIRVNAPEAGRYTIKLSYLAASVNWAANYVARLAPGGNRLDLTGWITVSNGGETGFANVPLDIIAGHVERAEGEDEPVEPSKVQRYSDCWPTEVNWAKAMALRDKFVAGAIGGLPDRNVVEALQRVSGEVMETVSVTGMRAARDLGDYKLYSLNGTTDINARQTKLIQFLDRKDVPFERYYFANIEDGEERRAASYGLRLKNVKENHLGIALPGGFFTATEVSDDHAPVVLGRQSFGDTAVDNPVELEMGAARDVTVQSKSVSREKIGYGTSKRERATGEFIVENHKTGPIDFELHYALREETKLTSESQSHTTTGNGFVWSLHLPPGESQTLRLTFEHSN